jgi:23S rRNA (uridine2552-2'-O)-methyltransferase
MPKPYIPHDKWSKRAEAEGYRARSVYKLMELDERFHLITPGMTILDLGAAPGSWLQYAAKKVGPRGRVIGIDLAEIAPIETNVSLHKEDITDDEAIMRTLRDAHVDTVDLVLSDVAPATSGVKDVDQWRSIELGQAVLKIAEKYLRPNGKCALKVFRGADFDEFLGETRKRWKDVRTVTVKASRDRSREVYLVMRKQ